MGSWGVLEDRGVIDGFVLFTGLRRGETATVVDVMFFMIFSHTRCRPWRELKRRLQHRQASVVVVEVETDMSYFVSST